MAELLCKILRLEIRWKKFLRGIERCKRIHTALWITEKSQKHEQRNHLNVIPFTWWMLQPCFSVSWQWVNLATRPLFSCPFSHSHPPSRTSICLDQSVDFTSIFPSPFKTSESSWTPWYDQKLGTLLIICCVFVYISPNPFLASPLIIEGRLISRASWLEQSALYLQEGNCTGFRISQESILEKVHWTETYRDQSLIKHITILYSICAFQFKNYLVVKENSQWSALQFFICNSRAL